MPCSVHGILVRQTDKAVFIKYDEAIVLDLFHQFTHDEAIVYGQRMASPQRSPCRIS